MILTFEKRNIIYVPQGCGHGFLTLEDDIEVFYQMSEFYNAEAECGGAIRHSRLLGRRKWKWFPKGNTRALISNDRDEPPEGSEPDGPSFPWPRVAQPGRGPFPDLQKYHR